MAFTEYTSLGLWGRLKNSLGGILVGLLIFAGACYLLWWNEGRAVKTARGLDEGYAQVISAHSESILPTNEGKLIHVIGFLGTDELLRDEEFGINTPSLKLKRHVNMYQWREIAKSEKKKKLGGSEETVTKYSYEKQWTNSLINSSHFKVPDGHSNPTAMRFTGYSATVDEAHLGSYRVPRSIMSQLGGFQKFRLNELDKELMPGAMIIDGDKEPRSRIYISDSGGSISNPQVGDIMIEFSTVAQGSYSVVARQIGNGLEAFFTSTGTQIEMVERGEVSAESMFRSAHQSNKLLMWGFRFGGFLLIFVGIRIIFRPLVVMGDIVPVVGRLLNFGFNLFAGIVGFTISMIIIGLAWIWFRPLLGVSLLVIGIGVFILFRRKNRVQDQSLPRPTNNSNY